MPDATPTPAGSAFDDASAAKGKKKPRSPVERAVVWGLILILGAATLFEFLARSSFQWSLAAIQNQLIAAERPGGNPVTESDVKALVSGYSGQPVVNERLEPNSYNASREDVYTFRSLLQSRKLYVYYGVQRPGKEREVLTASDEKVGPPPFRDFDLPPPDVRMGPPSQYSSEREGQPETADAVEPKATSKGESAKSPEQAATTNGKGSK